MRYRRSPVLRVEGRGERGNPLDRVNARGDRDKEKIAYQPHFYELLDVFHSFNA